MMLSQIVNNNQAMQNPIFSNAMQMYRQGNERGMQELANNIANQRGTNLNDLQNQLKNKLGI